MAVSLVFQRVLQAVLLFAIIMLGSQVGADRAVAGHTRADKICDSTPQNCWQIYNQGNLLYLHLEDQFSGWPCEVPEWWSPFNSGASSWTVQNGPQFFSWGFPQDPMGWVFLNCAFGDLENNAVAITDRCWDVGQCTHQAGTAVDISYAVLWFDVYQVDSNNARHWLVHEAGHALGLAHHCTGTCCEAVMSAVNCESVLSPTTTDIGYSPYCQGGSSTTWGIRCIYYW